MPAIYATHIGCILILLPIWVACISLREDLKSHLFTSPDGGGCVRVVLMAGAGMQRGGSVLRYVTDPESFRRRTGRAAITRP